MNQEDIIRMAREACDTDKVDAWHNDFWTITQEELERFAALVAAAEREACAKVCDPEPSPPNEAYTVLNNKATMRRCAAAIRARGNT